MKLEKVQKKKIWEYSYLTKTEMDVHVESMTKAGFTLEKIIKEKMIAILSQTINELKYEDIQFEKEGEIPILDV